MREIEDMEYEISKHISEINTLRQEIREAKEAKDDSLQHYVGKCYHQDRDELGDRFMKVVNAKYNYGIVAFEATGVVIEGDEILVYEEAKWFSNVLSGTLTEIPEKQFIDSICETLRFQLTCILEDE